MAGDASTGVQVMRMTEGLDEGPILASETVRIDTLETAGSLHDRLAPIGASLLSRTLAALERGGLRETQQSEDGVTYARKIRPSETRIDWGKSAAMVDRRIRGLSPAPGAWFECRGDERTIRVKALLSAVEDGRGAPGEVLDERLLIACGKGAVRILRAQREGRGAQGAADFLRGFPISPGVRLV
jgi:methionyl-tRNA formyltransferase